MSAARASLLVQVRSSGASMATWLLDAHAHAKASDRIGCGRRHAQTNNPFTGGIAVPGGFTAFGGETRVYVANNKREQMGSAYTRTGGRG